MREPTLEDSKKWATTPIASIMTKIVDKDGNEVFDEVWQRFESGKDKVVEILEGSPTKYHLRYESASFLRLIGVEE